MDCFCYFCFGFVSLSYLFLAALWSTSGKGLTSWLYCVCFCHFRIWCTGTGVLLDCIDSLSFPSSLLLSYAYTISTKTSRASHFIDKPNNILCAALTKRKTVCHQL